MDLGIARFRERGVSDPRSPFQPRRKVFPEAQQKSSAHTEQIARGKLRVRRFVQNTISMVKKNSQLDGLAQRPCVVGKFPFLREEKKRRVVFKARQDPLIGAVIAFRITADRQRASEEIFLGRGELVGGELAFKAKQAFGPERKLLMPLDPEIVFKKMGFPLPACQREAAAMR